MPSEEVFVAASAEIQSLCKNKPGKYLAHRQLVEAFLKEHKNFESHRDYVRHKKSFLYALRYRYHEDEDFALELDTLEEIEMLLSNSARRQMARLEEEDLVICRSQIKALEARIGRERGDSLTSVAASFLEAANASTPPPRRRQFRVHKEIQTQHHSFLSSHHKFSAFALLATHSAHWDRIRSHMRDAVAHAENARESCREEEIPAYENNVQYVSYWLHAVQMLDELLRKPRNFEAARHSLKNAIRCAKYFAGRDSIFPNRFYSIDDLCNESYFINAFEFFCARDFPAAHSELAQWLEKSKGFEGTWRHSNVRIRLLITELLAALYQNPSGGRRPAQIYTEILSITNHESVGLACLELIDRAQTMVPLLGLLQAEQEAILFAQMEEVFPLDSHGDEIKSLALYEKFKYHELDVLPRFFDDLYQSGVLYAERNDVAAFRGQIETMLRGLLSVANEYHYRKAIAFQKTDWFQGLPESFNSDFEKMSLEELADAIKALALALGKKALIESGKLDELKAFICDLRTRSDLKTLLSHLHTELLNKLLARLLPHVVLVEEEYAPSPDRIEFRVRRIWKKAVPEFLYLFSKGRKLKTGEFYYLRPQWKGRSQLRFSLDHDEFEVYPATLVPRMGIVGSCFISGVLTWDGDVSKLLMADEGPFFEFKPSDRLPYERDILEWMIAFGNNYPKGGHLVIGIDNIKDPETGRRKVVGFTVTEEFLNRLYNKIQSQVQPFLFFQVYRASWENKEFVVLHIPSLTGDAAEPYLLKGGTKTYFRDGASTNCYEGFQRIRQRFSDQMTKTQAA